MPASFSDKDEVMAEAFHHGDEVGLRYMHDQFFAALSLFAYKMVDDESIAKDIASEALMKAWKMCYKLDSFGAIRSYLYTIVYRDSLKAIKKEQRRTETERNGGLLTATFSPPPSDRIIEGEVYRLLHNALKDLPPGSRRVLEKYYFEEKSHIEIADELGLHVSTIKTQKQRGLKALKEKLSPLSARGFFKNNFTTEFLRIVTGIKSLRSPTTRANITATHF